MEVKGILITGTMDYLKKRFGEDSWNKFVKFLPEHIQKTLNGVLLPGGKYDSKIYIELNLEADKFFGKGDGKLLEDIGASTAEQSIELYHSIVNKKLKSPADAIQDLVPLLAKMLFENLESDDFFVDTGYGRYQIKGTALNDSKFTEVLAKRSVGWIREVLSKTGVSIIKSNYQFHKDPVEPSLSFEFWWE